MLMLLVGVKLDGLPLPGESSYARSGRHAMLQKNLCRIHLVAIAVPILLLLLPRFA